MTPSRRTCRAAGLALIGLWLVAFAPLVFSRSYVPDEAWFLGTAWTDARRSNVLAAPLFSPNHFGYGGVWWGLYAWTCRLTDALFEVTARAPFDRAVDLTAFRAALWDEIGTNPRAYAPLLAMRAVSLLSLTALLGKLLWSSRTPLGGLVTVLLGVALPLAWWSGKLASPEVPAACLVAWSAHDLLAALRWRRGFFVLGCAIGLKLSVMPMAASLALVALSAAWRGEGRRQALSSAPFTLAGVLLTTTAWGPLHPRAYLATLQYYSKLLYRDDAPLHRLREGLWGQNADFWELTPYGSLDYWAGSVIGVVTMIVIAWLRPETRRYAALLTLSGVAMMAFMATRVPHGWYWFAFILVAITVASLVEAPRAWPFAAAALAVHLALATTSIFEELAYRRRHLAELADAPTARICVEEVIARHPAGLVTDMGIVGHRLARPGSYALLGLPDVWYQASFIAPNLTGPDILIVGERMGVRTRPPAVMADGSPIRGQCGTTTWFFRPKER